MSVPADQRTENLSRRRSRPNRNGFCIENTASVYPLESRNRSFAAVLDNYM